jgi:uncharacterized repeat protein (TIGR01451 family)
LTPGAGRNKLQRWPKNDGKKMANVMPRMFREAIPLCILAFGLAAFSPQALAQAAVSDLSISKSAPSQVLPGATITYSISLTNLGPDASSGIQLTDPLPAGTTFVSFVQNSGPAFSCATPAVSGTGTVACGVSSLPNGQSASFTLVVGTNPASPGGFVTNVATVLTSTDPNPENDSATAVTRVGAFADLAVNKTGPASVATSGGSLAYGITLANNGPDAALSVALDDVIPAGTTFVSFVQNSGPAFVCITPAMGAGGTISCTIAALPSGAIAGFALTVQAAAAVEGTVITNTASASSTTSDPDPANNSASAFTVFVLPAADLAVSKTAPPTVAPGANVSYAIGLANSGPDPAQSTTLTDTLPAGTTFVSLTSAPGFTCTTPAVGAGGTVSCSIATLVSGATAAFTLVVQTNAGSGGTTITNTSSASSTTADPNPANNSASAMTAVVASADLAVTKTAPASISPGATVSYGIGLANNGPSAAQSVALTDTLPAGTTFVSFAQSSGPAFICTTPAVGAGGTVTCNIATLASAATAAFTLVVQTTAGSAGTTITNTASASSTTADPNPANNSASAATGVGTSADLAVTKTGPASAPAGANLSYNIVVTNNGPSTSLSVTLTDALPAGTTFVSFAQASGPAFTCTTPAVGAGGTVSCNIATLAPGAPAAFTLVARSAFGSAGTTIANTASASSATADPTPGNNSATASTSSTAARTFSGPSATGSGTITASFIGGGPTCGYSNAEFIPVTGNPRSPPAGSAPSGIAFPHGLFDFTISGCVPGSTLAFTIVYPAALPPGTAYWKYGPRPGVPTPQWYILPATVSGDTVTFTITDGALGDDDLAANGTIVDQGGPGVPGPVGAPLQVPTLSEWMQLLLAGFILALGLASLRRRAR